MKVVMGLGNPGPEYENTRHNVGWWVVDRLAYDWGFGPFRKERNGLAASGAVEDEDVLLVKPTTFMNRSGLALRPLRDLKDFEPTQDLLVVVDDAALEVGKVRFRARGGPGGHNGLKSIAGALRSQEFPRLRIGVGLKPEGWDLSDWVLSEMPAEDEEVVVELLPELTEGVEVWIKEGIEAAMNRFNR
ncbi:MAG: aminoacyl-tRNA hydrolase [Gemmatimonadota bacterium]